jgi:hypothetical protein
MKYISSGFYISNCLLAQFFLHFFNKLPGFTLFIKTAVRTLLLFFLFLFSTEACLGQKISQRRLRKHRARVYASMRDGTVILSLDTIYNKGIPYAILIKKKQLPYHDYILFSLNRERLAYIQSKTTGGNGGTEYYAVKFERSGKVAEPEKYITFHLEKEVVACNLVEGNAINPFGELKFLKKYPPKFSGGEQINAASETSGTNIYVIVERDRSKDILVAEGSIYQDYRLIGKYKVSEARLRFYLPGGIMTAEAVETESDSGVWKISSFKDKKEHTLHTTSGKSLAEIIDFLAQKEYL